MFWNPEKSRVQTCCGYFPLKKGSLIIAISGLLLNALYLLLIGMSVVQIEEKFDLEEENGKMDKGVERILILNAIMFLVVFFNLGIFLVLLIGTIQEKAALVKLWVNIEQFFLAISIFFVFVTFFGVIINFAIMSYCILVARSYYFEIIEKEHLSKIGEGVIETGFEGKPTSTIDYEGDNIGDEWAPAPTTGATHQPYSSYEQPASSSYQ